jgi:hypothetical protein
MAKVGSFDTSELRIDEASKRLIHKESGVSVPFEKKDNEMENIREFRDALYNLAIRYGLWLIDQI